MTEKRNSRIALLAVVMLLSGAFLGLMSEDSSAATNNAVGFISSGDPSGVDVTIINQASGVTKSATSASDGSYSFEDLDDGDYSVRYSKDGLLSVLDSWSIPADLPLDDVAMSAAPSGETNVTINVTDSDDENISGATVYLSSSTTEDSWWTDVSVGYTVSNTTSDEGSAGFALLTDDQYDIRVEASGHYTAFGDTSDTDITMTAFNDDNKQTVRVYDPSGNPLGDATVFMYDASSSTWYDSSKVGYTYYLQPETDSEVYVYAYHESHSPSVKKILSVSGIETHNMEVGSNSASDDGVVYINAEPADGGQALAPMFGDRMIKLNPGPTASIDVSGTTDVDGNHVVAAGENVNFSASSSSSPVGGLTYNWGTESTEDYSASFVASSDPHTVTLTVTDEFGATSSESVSITADGISPEALFTTTVKASTDDDGVEYDGSNIDEDFSTVIFNASSSSDAVGIDSYSWDFGDESSDTGDVVSHIFDNPGSFDVTLTATDAAGNSASTSVVITVNDVTIPSAAFNWSYVNETGGTVVNAAMEGEPTIFNAGASTDNSNGDLTYNWNFGDGQLGSGETVSHTFENLTDDGFDVILTVADAAGNEDVTSYNIKPASKERPDIFISSLTFSDDNPEEGDTVTLDATVKVLGMNVTGEFEVAFYLDGLDGEQIGSVSVNGSELSFGIENEFNVSATWKATSGAHSIVVVADSTDLIDESEEKNELSKIITVSAEDDSSDVTSMVMIIAVVLLSVGSVGYIYRDSLFSK